MAGYFAGDRGQLMLGRLDGSRKAVEDTPVQIAHVQSWTLNQSMTTYSVEALGFTDRILYPGIRSLSGSARILYYRVTNSVHDAPNIAQEAVSYILQQNMKKENDGNAAGGNDPDNPVSREMLFKLGFSGSNNYKVFFSGYVTQISMSCNIGEVTAADISFEANGAPIANDLF